MSEVTIGIWLVAIVAAVVCYRVTGGLPFFNRDDDSDEQSSDRKSSS